MYSWREVHAFSQPLTVPAAGGEAGPEAKSNDEIVTFRPMALLPVIVWNKQTQARQVVPMRWGYPDPNNPRIPKHIHVRSETIDTTKAFASQFLDGQRGIVVFRTFNEGKELSPSKTEQWTIDPGDGIPRGFSFLWQRFEIGGEPPFLACVQVTVPASKLIEPITDRMPAILEEEDWKTWLGETPATHDEVKAVLKTMENVNWRIAPEPKPQKPPKPPKEARPKATKPVREEEPGLF